MLSRDSGLVDDDEDNNNNNTHLFTSNNKNTSTNALEILMDGNAQDHNINNIGSSSQETCLGLLSKNIDGINKARPSSRFKLPTIDELSTLTSATLSSQERPMRGIRLPRSESLSTQKFMETMASLSQTIKLSPDNSLSSSSCIIANNDENENVGELEEAKKEGPKEEITIIESDSKLGVDVIQSDIGICHGKGECKTILSFRDAGIDQSSNIISNNKNYDKNECENENDDARVKTRVIESPRAIKNESPTNKRRPTKVEVQERLRKLLASFSSTSLSSASSSSSAQSPYSPSSPTESRYEDEDLVNDVDREEVFPTISASPTHSNLMSSRLLPSTMFEKTLGSIRLQGKHS